jgi:acyl carrier protein
VSDCGGGSGFLTRFRWILERQKNRRKTVPTPEEIEQKVISIVSSQMSRDAKEITRETSFINDLGADSLDTVELVMEFEDAFDLSIPDEEAEKIQTVGQAVDYIQNNLNSEK